MICAYSHWTSFLLAEKSAQQQGAVGVTMDALLTALSELLEEVAGRTDGSPLGCLSYYLVVPAPLAGRYLRASA